MKMSLKCLVRMAFLACAILAGTAAAADNSILNSTIQQAASSPKCPDWSKSAPSFQRIGEYSVERLNKILTEERAAFSGFAVEFPKATNAVTLYKVVYDTVIPEDGNRPVKASGLIAVPEVDGWHPPVLFYQHGTVFSRNEVPSDIEKSAETRLVVAAFAARGYIVIAADYLGKGVSDEPEAWLVKESSAQVCVDMLTAARSVLAELKKKPAELFLCGWSQGTLNTAAFLERLENTGVPVRAAGFASAPNDIYLCVNRWIHVPSKLDVNWLTGAAALLIHSYEHYYKLPGLAAAAIKPEYQQTASDLYHNRITWEAAELALPFYVQDFLRPEFIERNSPAASLLFRQMQANRVYNWRFKTRTFYYYGDIDEVVTPYMVQLPVEYQKTLGGKLPVAVAAGEKADHRGTFLFSLADLKKRFDATLSKKR